MGHVSYSLWLLTPAAAFALMPAASIDLLIALAVVPAIWTACRTGCDSRRANAIGPHSAWRRFSVALSWLGALGPGWGESHLLRLPNITPGTRREFGYDRKNREMTRALLGGN